MILIRAMFKFIKKIDCGTWKGVFIKMRKSDDFPKISITQAILGWVNWKWPRRSFWESLSMTSSIIFCDSAILTSPKVVVLRLSVLWNSHKHFIFVEATTINLCGFSFYLCIMCMFSFLLTLKSILTYICFRSQIHNLKG